MSKNLHEARNDCKRKAAQRLYSAIDRLSSPRHLQSPPSTSNWYIPPRNDASASKIPTKIPLLIKLHRIQPLIAMTISLPV